MVQNDIVLTERRCVMLMFRRKVREKLHLVCKEWIRQKLMVTESFSSTACTWEWLFFFEVWILIFYYLRLLFCVWKLWLPAFRLFFMWLIHFYYIILVSIFGYSYHLNFSLYRLKFEFSCPFCFLLNFDSFLWCLVAVLTSCVSDCLDCFHLFLVTFPSCD